MGGGAGLKLPVSYPNQLFNPLIWKDKGGAGAESQESKQTEVCNQNCGKYREGNKQGLV